jgi:hypothetical protein
MVKFGAAKCLKFKQSLQATICKMVTITILLMVAIIALIPDIALNFG